MHVTFGIKLLKKSFYFAALLILASLVLLSKDGECAPQLLYVSAPSGPNYGWENSTTKGAAITIWGYNLGTSRGANTVTVAGVTLGSDSSYAEWGATTNPQTAKGMQRITFWLNSSMANGNTSGISVTVGGVTSNVLPFTIDNTGATRIRFVDVDNGLTTNNGMYATQGSGANGPWKYAFEGTDTGGPSPRQELPGMFIYLRGRTYGVSVPSGTACADPVPIAKRIQYAGWNAPHGEGYVGLDEDTCSGGVNLSIFPKKHGTAANRITITSYPGENAIFMNMSFGSMSNYRTFANFTISGSSSACGPYIAAVIGNPATYFDGCINNKIVGNQLIGIAWIGYLHSGFQIWGSGHNIVANYVNNYPTSKGFGPTNSYLYVASSDNLLIQNNEFHGGSHYNMQIYDEPRGGGGGLDNGRGHRDIIVDSNLFDMDESKIWDPLDAGPYSKDLSLILGMNATQARPAHSSNIVIKNNIWNITDTPSVNDTCFSLYWEGGYATMDNLAFLNNTCNGSYIGIWSSFASHLTLTNFVVKNNIFSNMSGNHFETENANIKPSVWNNNLTMKAFSSNVSIAENLGNIVGNPLFVNPSSWDFRLQLGSPAIGAGVNLSPIVTRDFAWKTRPATSGWSVGAFEGMKMPKTPDGVTVE